MGVCVCGGRGFVDVTDDGDVDGARAGETRRYDDLGGFVLCRGMLYRVCCTHHSRRECDANHIYKVGGRLHL